MNHDTESRAIFVVWAKPKGRDWRSAKVIARPDLGVFGSIAEANAAMKAGIAGEVFKNLPPEYLDRMKFKLSASAESFRTLRRALEARRLN